MARAGRSTCTSRGRAKSNWVTKCDAEIFLGANLLVISEAQHVKSESHSSAESATRGRYAAAAHQAEAALCCPVEYDPKFLEVIPKEVIEKDYGCGDPSQYLKLGETVLDLGSGTGKICFIAAQVVGAEGKVIGVDMTDDMLEVARRNAPLVAEKIGFSNVSFVKGRIQDLGLDLEKLDAVLQSHPVSDANGFMAAEETADQLRVDEPLIADNSIDVVVSNCVLNLVDNRLKDQLFDEIFRVLKPGGRAVISDIVSDEEIPQALQDDPYLWSGCISGAYTEVGFLEAFELTGFYGIEQLKRDVEPWQTVEGIEFRSVTIQAWKGEEEAELERNQAVIYRGPFKMIVDDEGNAMERGERYAVSDLMYRRLQGAPYRKLFDFVDPNQEVPLVEAGSFDLSTLRLRTPQESKGEGYRETSEASSCCEGDGCC